MIRILLMPALVAATLAAPAVAQASLLGRGAGREMTPIGWTCGTGPSTRSRSSTWG